jgi:predicted RNA binding protein YcfA (HicA-like mRNA interferase family)
MAWVDRLLDHVLASRGPLAFRDLERLLAGLGFELRRVSGSHYIFQHPRVPRPLNVQPHRGEAKPYQLRQLRDMIVEFGLGLDDAP